MVLSNVKKNLLELFVSIAPRREPDFFTTAIDFLVDKGFTCEQDFYGMNDKAAEELMKQAEGGYNPVVPQCVTIINELNTRMAAGKNNFTGDNSSKPIVELSIPDRLEALGMSSLNSLYIPLQKELNEVCIIRERGERSNKKYVGFDGRSLLESMRPPWTRFRDGYTDEQLKEAITQARKVKDLSRAKEIEAVRGNYFHSTAEHFSYTLRYVICNVMAGSMTWGDGMNLLCHTAKLGIEVSPGAVAVWQENLLKDIENGARSGILDHSIAHILKYPKESRIGEAKSELERRKVTNQANKVVDHKTNDDKENYYKPNTSSYQPRRFPIYRQYSSYKPRGYERTTESDHEYKNGYKPHGRGGYSQGYAPIKHQRNFSPRRRY